MNEYRFQPGRVIVAAVIFTAIVAWQADLRLVWWLPALLAFILLFAGLHAFYNWANIKIREATRPPG